MVQEESKVETKDFKTPDDAKGSPAGRYLEELALEIKPAKKRKYTKGSAWHIRRERLRSAAARKIKAEKTDEHCNLNNTLREFIIWGETFCSIQNTPRRMCGHCWNELKEKAGL